MKETLKNKMRRYVLLGLHNEKKPNLCFGKEIWVVRKKREEKTGSCSYEISWVTASSAPARQKSKYENKRKLRIWYKKQRNISYIGNTIKIRARQWTVKIIGLYSPKGQTKTRNIHEHMQISF